MNDDEDVEHPKGRRRYGEEVQVFDQKVGLRRSETSESTQDEGDGNAVSDATGLDSPFDPSRVSRSLSTRMRFWQATPYSTETKTTFEDPRCPAVASRRRWLSVKLLDPTGPRPYNSARMPTLTANSPEQLA